jgi:hypothetical protein
MPVTQVGAIFATASKLLQRVYIPHADDSEIPLQHVGAGETLLNVPIATYRTGGAAAVQSVIGTPTFSGRCVVVDKNTNLVTNAIIADPAIYADPSGNTVMAHDVALPGDLWTGTQFTRRYVEITPANGTVISVSTQPIMSAKPVTATNFLVSSPTLNTGNIVANLIGKVAAVA